MPDNVKIKVGIKSNKGIRKENNDDRVLIGMDPAANDWLYSPDQIQLGEFGLLIMIADGIGDSQHSGEGAQILCKTIKHLFDQTLELPPDDDELIRILEKYIHVANSHISWHVVNHENISSLGVSFALGLIKSEKIYIVWCGNARVYRYQEKGVAGSFFTDHPLFELLTVDHTIDAEYKLFAPNSAIPTHENSLKQFLGDSTQTLHLSSRVLTFCQGDKFLFSSEGLTEMLTTNELASIISQNIEPQDITIDLIQAALSASTPKNSTASLIEIIEGPPAPVLKLKNKETLLDEAKSFFGLNSILVDVPTKEIERKKLMAFNKMTEKKADIPIEPMKVRTVLPDEYDELDKIDSKTAPNVLNTTLETGDLMEQMDKLNTKPLNEEKIEENEKVEIPIQVDNSDKDISHQNDPAKEQSKLRIKVTVYPDSESNEKVEIAKQDSINDEPIAVNSIEEIQDSNPSNDDSELGELIVDLDIEEDEGFSESSQEIDEENLIDEEIDEEDPPISQMSIFEVDQPNLIEETHESITESIERTDQEDEDLESSEQLIPEDVIFNTQEFTENKQGIPEDVEMNSTDGGTYRIIPIWNSISSFIDTVKPKWPYIISIIIILLISVWICNSADENELIPGQLNGEDVSIPKPEIDKKTPIDNNEKKEIITESTEKKTDPAKVNSEQKKIEKKEEKPKTKTIVSEPEYDSKIQQNKHQLLDEIVALWSTKKELCKRIVTYRKNAPEKKQEKLDALVYNCDQLEQKFSSIYDEKSGYFRTVRYDFLIGTITNIKVSLKQTEDKLEEIRIE